jgi:ketosteroid isomerase-like protein
MAFGLEQTGENMTGNCSLVRSLYDAFGCDPTAIFYRLDPSAAWISSTMAKAISWGDRHSGVAGAASFFKALTETLDFEVFKPRQFFAAADNVIVFGRTQARVKIAGRKFDSERARVFIFHRKSGEKTCHGTRY